MSWGAAVGDQDGELRRVTQRGGGAVPARHQRRSAGGGRAPAGLGWAGEKGEECSVAGLGAGAARMVALLGSSGSGVVGSWDRSASGSSAGIDRQRGEVRRG